MLTSEEVIRLKELDAKGRAVFDSERGVVTMGTEDQQTVKGT